MAFSKEIKIGQTNISRNTSVYIIAEAGVNHNGDIEVAKQLVDIAADAGVNAVKFQAFKTEHLIIEDVEKAPYQKSTTSASESQADMLRKLELNFEQYKVLKAYCESKNIQFLITPFDEFSLNQLEEIGVEAYKVASTDTTNIPFLLKIAATGKPMILSTGMCYMEEVEQVMKAIEQVNKDVLLMQCTANYPIEDNEVNMAVLHTYQEAFDCLLGYSDHTVGLGASPYSVMLGAVAVEKHFTINKDNDGPDHRASLSPEELKQFVKEIRRCEQYLGSSVKQPTTSELGTRKMLQKNLVAKTDIAAGTPFTLDNIVAKRTGGAGISPINYEKVIGQIAKQDYKTNQIIAID